MKRIILILILLSLYVPCFASERDNKPVTTSTAYSTSQLIQTGITRVYRIYFTPTSNGGYFALHNCLTIGTTASTTAKAEGKEASSGNSVFQDYSINPLEFNTGLYLDVSNGIVLVEYE